MIIKFDQDKGHPHKAQGHERTPCGLVVDLASRRKRTEPGEVASKRNMRGALRLPVLPGKAGRVPIIARYVSGVREIAVRQSLKVIKEAPADG